MKTPDRGYTTETLRWDDYLGKPSVEAAYQQLLSSTHKALLLHSRSLFPKIPRPFWCASCDAIHIFIDEASPNVAHSIVHELIHGILMEQGYHRLNFRLGDPVRGTLSNEFQHPEVFRRMEGYGLDMDPYWERGPRSFDVD